MLEKLIDDEQTYLMTSSSIIPGSMALCGQRMHYYVKMKPFSSSPYSNGRMVNKRPIPIITIDSDEDDNEDFSSSAVKRGKNEATTEFFENEATISAESLKEDGKIKDSLFDLNEPEVSNASNVTSDAEVQHLKDLIQDILKGQSLADDEISAEQFNALDDIEICINNTLNIIKAPNFEFQTTATGNKRLIVFDQNDKTLCYKFYAGCSLFGCGKCWEIHHKSVSAKLLKDENGDDYVQMVNQHFCKPVKYVPQSPNFQIQQKEIINAPNYEFQIKQNGKRVLVIFVPSNPNLCYYYTNMTKNYFACCECKKSFKKTTSAKLLEDKDGKEFVQANFPHLCEPVPYVANKWQKLRNFCYHYDYYKWSNGFKCIACLDLQQIPVSAKLIKDEKGNECLQAINHLCDPFTYKISDAFDILKSPNFKFVIEETTGSLASILVLYETIARSTGYTFTQMGSTYACSGCLSKGREFIAKLFKDENDEDVVLVWKRQKHICLPIICL